MQNQAYSKRQARGSARVTVMHAHHGFACDPRTVPSCESFDDDALLGRDQWFSWSHSLSPWSVPEVGSGWILFAVLPHRLRSEI